jgi:hypothetical protein
MALRRQRRESLISVHPQRNSLRSRLDLHILVPAPQVPNLAEELDFKGLTKIFNSSGLTGRALERGHAFADPSRVNQKLPEPAERGDRQLSKRPDEVAKLEGLEPLSYDWTRNPITVADTLSVTIHPDDVPVDLRLIRGAQVRAWLFCHELLDACRPGDPGYFGGVVDVVERDRNNGSLTLECRDYTAFPLNHKVSPQTLAEVDLSQVLPDVVRYLIDKMPGGERWRVEGRGKVARFAAPASFLAEEKRKRIKKRQRKLNVTMVGGATAGALAGLADDWKQGYALVAQDQTLGIVGEDGRPIAASPLAPKLDAQRPAYVSAMPILYRDSSQADELGTWTEVATPAKYRTVKVPPSAQTIFGSSDLSTWDAIVRLCSLMGCLPEVTTWRDGSVGILIMAADEVHASTDLKGSFSRTIEGQEVRHRVFVDGEGVDLLNERRELEAGAKVDFVELQASDPDTGRTRRSRFGKLGPEEGVDLTDPQTRKGYERKGKRRVPYGVTQGRGVFMIAHGITSQKHLDRLARTAWLSLTSGEFKLEIESKVPWSYLGDSNDPDLLACSSGAAIELRFKGLERTNVDERVARSDNSKSHAQAYYEARRLDLAAAKILGDATSHSNLPLVFQVSEVRHSYSGTGDGDYSCRLACQGFVGLDEAPDLTEDEWAKAQDDAWEEEQETDDEEFEP